MISGGLPSGYKSFRNGSIRLVCRLTDATALLEAGVLDGATPEQWGRPLGTRGGGRRPLLIVATPGLTTPLLVKTLSRGGWLGPLLGRTVGSGRALRELVLVTWLRSRNVRTPPILAVRMRRRFGFWGLARVETVIPLLEPSMDLMVWLRGQWARELRRRVLVSAGRAVATMHAAGVAHQDLNLANLLVDGEGSVHLLDMGRSRKGPCGDRPRAGNLARLYRSAVKVGLVPAQLSNRDVLRFLRAYRPGGWRDIFRRARRIYRCTLPFHRISWWLGAKRI